MFLVSGLLASLAMWLVPLDRMMGGLPAWVWGAIALILGYAALRTLARWLDRIPEEERLFLVGLVAPFSVNRVLSLLIAIVGVCTMWLLARSPGAEYVSEGVLWPVVLGAFLDFLQKGEASLHVLKTSGSEGQSGLNKGQEIPKIQFVPRIPSKRRLPEYLRWQEKEKDQEDKRAVVYETYEWTCGDRRLKVRLPIRLETYEAFKEKVPVDEKGYRRVEISRWAEVYVAGGLCPEIFELVARLTRAMGYTFPSSEEVMCVLRFVQENIQYEYDLNAEGEKIDYAKFPIETLKERKGDCEDVAILGAALLRVMGYDVALLLTGPPVHMALGVAGYNIGGPPIRHEGKDYYFAELTSEGWQIGQIPKDYTPETIKVYPVPLKVVVKENDEESTGQ